MKITSRRGDKGRTDSLDGKRLSKTHPRISAIGALDEATSSIGFARSLAKKGRTKKILLQIQKDLATLSSEISSGPVSLSRLPQRIGEDEVKFLEERINQLEKLKSLPEGFVIPGSGTPSAALDVARAVLRRAEREVVSLSQRKMLRNPSILRYLNRLSDLLWVLARSEEEKPQVLQR